MAKRPRILLVEDDLQILDIYKDKFSKSGFEIFTSISAEEGIALLKKKKPDLVILDILLPKGDGIFFLKEQKKDGEVASIPVIAFSNFDDPETKEKAKSMGVKDYLIKANLTPNEVVLKVKEYLPNLFE